MDQAGPLLVRAGLIAPERFRVALEALAETPERTLIEELVASGALTEERLCRFFHDRLLVPIIGAEDLGHASRRALKFLDGAMAAQFRCLPINVDAHRNLVLAMADPSDTHAVDEVAFATGMTVFRAVAPASAVARAILDLYGIATPLALAPTPAGPEPAAARRSLPLAEIVDDVYSEDTPIPAPIPFDQTTGRIVLIDPRSLATTLAQMDRGPEAAEAALREAVAGLEGANDPDTIGSLVVSFMKSLCRRGAFFVVRRGQLAGWMGLGHGVSVAALREAALSLDRPSTFRELVQTRLPYRGPVLDAASRDFLIDGLGWAPHEMLAVPLAVRDRVLAVAYGDERIHPLPDEFLQTLSRAAELALERALAARRQP